MKAESYIAPFETTDDITNLTIEIGESVGRITAHDSLSLNPKLRRENRIKTRHSTLAIEQNNLSHAQVTDVINGKRVLAPPQDIREVQNAYKAYEHLIHADTPPVYAAELVGQLFTRMKTSKLHPLEKSCVFHYGFEFIKIAFRKVCLFRLLRTR